MFGLISFSLFDRPQFFRTSTICVLHDHSQTHYNDQDYSGRVISPTYRPLPDSTQHYQQTDINAPVGFEPANPARHCPQTHTLDRRKMGLSKLQFVSSR